MMGYRCAVCGDLMEYKYTHNNGGKGYNVYTCDCGHAETDDTLILTPIISSESEKLIREIREVKEVVREILGE